VWKIWWCTNSEKIGQIVYGKGKLTPINNNFFRFDFGGGQVEGSNSQSQVLKCLHKFFQAKKTLFKIRDSVKVIAKKNYFL
jgi:hypothetical protein